MGNAPAQEVTPRSCAILVLLSIFKDTKKVEGLHAWHVTRLVRVDARVLVLRIVSRARKAGNLTRSKDALMQTSASQRKGYARKMNFVKIPKDLTLAWPATLHVMGALGMGPICAIDNSTVERQSQMNTTRYLTYSGLAIVSLIVFQKNAALASLIGLAFGVYIATTEYLLTG